MSPSRITLARQDFERNVFINCPFDTAYQPLFDAIVFAVQACGLKARCAREVSNAADFRLEKIMGIIAACQYGVHDLSRTELAPNNLPRFNMPLELGLDLGCKRYGNRHQHGKKLLIMDTSKHRYQKFISDIAGQDIEDHRGLPGRAITRVRDWLSTATQWPGIAGGAYMGQQYLTFLKDVPDICRSRKLRPSQLTFLDLLDIIELWQQEQ